jgi:GNAT superfamily N-acetyltransferase
MVTDAFEVRIATHRWELEQIHRLNYVTFVDEIPQHAAHPSGILVDRFDADNIYLIAVRGEQVVGMVAVRGSRPFSLDLKLGDITRYVPGDRRYCELRLLAIAKQARSGRILPRLLASVRAHCDAHGYDAALISGTTRQLRLYRRLGFEPFGPRTGAPGAHFQPMILTRERAVRFLPRVLASPF